MSPAYCDPLYPDIVANTAIIHMNDWVWECNCTWELYTAISLINEYHEQLDGIAGARAIPMDFFLADAL